MPTFKFTSPDGAVYNVDGPDGATPEQAFGVLQQHLSNGTAAPAQATAAPAPAPSSLADTAKNAAVNIFGGAMKTGAEAIATASAAVGAHDLANQFDEYAKNWGGTMQENGGDTLVGKTSQIVGSVAGVLALPEAKLVQFGANLGLFAAPAFRSTYNDKIAQGESQSAALTHATAAGLMNLLMPELSTKGAGAVMTTLGLAGKDAAGQTVSKIASGGGRAAADIGTAVGEGVGFSAANSVIDKGIDTAYGEKNDHDWIDGKDMLANALAFSVLRGKQAYGQLTAKPDSTVQTAGGTTPGQQIDEVGGGKAAQAGALNPDGTTPPVPPPAPAAAPEAPPVRPAPEVAPQPTAPVAPPVDVPGTAQTATPREPDPVGAQRDAAARALDGAQTVDQMISAAQALATRPRGPGGTDFSHLDTDQPSAGEQARVAKLREAIDQHAAVNQAEIAASGKPPQMAAPNPKPPEPRFVDTTPVTDLNEARVRLAQLRERAPEFGVNPNDLVLAPHPTQQGAFAVRVADGREPPTIQGPQAPTVPGRLLDAGATPAGPDRTGQRGFVDAQAALQGRANDSTGLARDNESAARQAQAARDAQMVARGQPETPYPNGDRPVTPVAVRQQLAVARAEARSKGLEPEGFTAEPVPGAQLKSDSGATVQGFRLRYDTPERIKAADAAAAQRETDRQAQAAAKAAADEAAARAAQAPQPAPNVNRVIEAMKLPGGHGAPDMPVRFNEPDAQLWGRADAAGWNLDPKSFSSTERARLGELREAFGDGKMPRVGDEAPGRQAPFRQGVEQRALLREAERLYAKPDLDILRKAANQPFALTAAERIRLRELKEMWPKEAAPEEKPPAPAEEPPKPGQPAPAEPPAAGPAKSVKELMTSEADNPTLRGHVESKNFAGVAEHLAGHSNPVYRRIGQLAARLKTKLVERDLPSNVAGSFSPRSDTIAIAPRYRGDEHTVAHEVAHALSADAITHGRSNPRLAPFVKRLSQLRDHIRAMAERGEGGFKAWEHGPGGDYGTSDHNRLHEFLAEGLTNSDFQAKLAAVPWKRGTMWSKFVESIGGMLGIKPSQHNALMEVLHVSEKLMKRPSTKPLNRENDPDLMDPRERGVARLADYGSVRKPRSPDDYNGRAVTYPVHVAETGETAHVTVDAGRELGEYQERESVMQKVLDCLK